MVITHTLLEIATQEPIGVYDVTAEVQTFLAKSGVLAGQVMIFSRNTTTAIAINEYEERLLVDLQRYLKTLAPPEAAYLHNDLHLRDVPPDEPENAHSHLMAMTLSNSEVLPVAEGQLALGTYQSILFVELDGPRERQLWVQVSGIA